MSEVLEKKKLELNEKVDFSLAAVSEAEGGFIRRSAGAGPPRALRYDLQRPESTVLLSPANFWGLFFPPSMKQQRLEFRPSGSNATARASSYRSVNWGVWEPAKER